MALAAFMAIAYPAFAHHRQTPPVVEITTAGDSAWPRLRALGDRLVYAYDTGAGRQIFLRERDRVTFDQLTDTGDNANPAVSSTGRVVAWDSDADFLGSGAPGRQVFVMEKGELVQAAIDPTGTSVNPSLNGRGRRLAFESTGDLAGTGNAGARQIFVSERHGLITQMSRGLGTSSNPTYGRNNRRLAFESTSDPDSGADTGVSQIWLTVTGRDPFPITAGEGGSHRPSMSTQSRLIAFHSTADLAGDGHDTGVSQVFVYQIGKGIFRQITDDAGGCSDATINDRIRAWRVAYVCGDRGFYTDIRTEQRFALPIATDGDTAQAVAAGGNQFVLIGTTVDVLNGGTTPGHRLYQLNLFKLASDPIAVGGIQQWTVVP